MTLIELLVALFAIGAIATVLSAAIVVTLRQQAGTEARTDVARWEQALALWLPSDLASAGLPESDPASGIDVLPGSVPALPGGASCALPECDPTRYSNALLLRWGSGSFRTEVSYRYGESPAGSGEYVLLRVECSSSGCSSQVVLRDLASPPDQTPPWAPPDEVPDTVINVTAPLDTSGSPVSMPNAQRVIVNVNGAPGADGVDRSSTVSFTAGGMSRTTIPDPEFEGPTFLDAQSACGGPITLIVDESGSIGGADDDIEDAVENFIDTFDGTPTRLQVIEFSGTARVVGSGGNWNRFYDLSQPAEVAALKSALNINAGGSTNWEDALFRAFYAQNGQTYAELGDPNAPTPELVVFFTDGEPTVDRQDAKSDSAPTNPPTVQSPYNHDTNGGPGDLSPNAWYRADWVADQFRSIRIIGIGAGPTFDQSTRVYRPGWPISQIPNETFLGDLVSAGDPSQYGTGASGNYTVSDYEAQGGSWGDVSNADLLVTNNLNNVSSALSEIALSECGGTLTVQTRVGSTAGPNADIDVTYRIDAEQSSTSAVRKAATFDVAVASGSDVAVQLVPQIDTPGWEATGWSCTSKGVDLGSDYGEITAGTPGDGIDITVGANDAVACTMAVAQP